MILEITVPLDAIDLLGGQSLPDGTSLEIGRTVSIAGTGTTSLRVAGDGVEDVLAALRENPAVDEVLLVGDTAEVSTYHVRLADGPPELVERVWDAGGTVVSAAAEGDSWTLELRFPDQDAASGFYARYGGSDDRVGLQYSSPTATSRRESNGALTSEQREALDRAFETGYFEVPRRTSTADLAADLNISDTAVSQRLRRGVANILREADYTSSPVVDSHRGGK
jgi:predicted DNA binding protein